MSALLLARDAIGIDAEHRGNGIADGLLVAAERVIAAAGYPSAWLAVVAGNERARRFYDRNGWTDEGDFIYPATVQTGQVDVPCCRYTKAIHVSSILEPEHGSSKLPRRTR